MNLPPGARSVREIVHRKTGGSGRRLERCDDKVQKCTRLRGKMMTRWVQRIERKSFVKPIRKNDLQPSTLDQRFDSKFEQLCYPVTGEADCVQGCNIAQQQLRFRADLDFFTALTERPFVGTPGLRVPEINQTMIAFLEPGGMVWASSSFQIGW